MADEHPSDEDDPEGRYDAVLRPLGLPRISVSTQVAAAYQHARATAAAGGPAWQPIGPRNLAGAVRTLVQDPGNSDVLYAGSSGGGVWKTETHGRSWFRLATSIQDGGVREITGPVSAIGVWAHDPRFVVVGTGEQERNDHTGLGLFISPDGGITFHHLLDPIAYWGHVDLRRTVANPRPRVADHYGNIAVDPHNTTVAGPGTASSVGTTLTRAGGASLIGVFAVDDFVEANNQRRRVTAVTAGTLTLDRAFVPDLPANTAYRRVTPRYWAGAETGLWRFEPGQGWRQDWVLPAPPGTIARNNAADPARIDGTGTQFQTTFRHGNRFSDFIRVHEPASPGPADQQLTHRERVDTVNNNTRVTSTVGLAVRAPGTAYRREVQCDDIRAITMPGNANQTLLVAGMHEEGVFRGVFNRTTGALAWTRPRLARSNTNNAAMTPRMFERVRVSNIVAQGAHQHVYAIMQNHNAVGFSGRPSHVYHSTDGAQTFTARHRPNVGSNGANAHYCLTIACDPTTPLRVLVGGLEVYFSANGGQTAFRRILEWTEYDTGTVRRQAARRGDFEGGDFLAPRAQHADVHAVLFDARTPAEVWVAHDAGICHNASVPAGENPAANRPPRFSGWRLRSYGIQSAQFYDATCNPFQQSMIAGGLQDNGTALSYGGSTWYHVGGGDGGRVAFSNNPRRFYASWQGTNTRPGYARVEVAPPAVAAGDEMYNTPLPDVPDAPNSDADVLRARWHDHNPGQHVRFHPLVEGHPTASDELLYGTNRRIRRTTNPQNNVPGFTSLGAMLGAGTAALQTARGQHAPVCAAFVPRAPSTEFWFGTNHGEVWRRHNGNSLQRTPAWVGASPWVVDVAVADRGAPNPIGEVRVAVVASPNGGAGELWLADVRPGNNAVAWTQIVGGPPGPLTAVRFEPNDPTRLYVGTLAGVYRCDNLPAWGAALPGAPRWRTYNNGLPLGLVEALDVSPNNTLVGATYGHGMWEVPLNATAAATIPAVKLVVRNHIADNARPNQLTEDPRVAAGSRFGFVHSSDIRVDAPRHARRAIFAFGEPLDAAEFDEVMRPESPIRGDRNVVYVHVQNRGHTAATDVQVHLYWAEATNNTTVGDLQAGFRAGFPNVPAGRWQRAAPPVTIGRLGPGEPHVAQFDWVPAHGTGSHVALMAITQNAQDAAGLTAANMSDVVATLAQRNRHVAVRIAPAVGNPIRLRDGVEDQGVPGAVAWGARSPDILVLSAAPPANPHTQAAFQDLLDARRGDRVRAGDNWILVRVHNRSSTPVQAEVEVYQVPRAHLGAPGSWNRLGAVVQTPQIPANSWRFTAPITWNVAAPDPTTLLVAIARQVGAPVAPFPSHSEDVRDLRSLWRFLRTGISADRTAARALRRQ